MVATAPTLSELDDNQLLVLARAGDARARPAFGQLAKRHQAWLIRLLYYLLHNQSEAEDVGQETLVRAFTAISEFRGNSSFRGWLRVIATRLAFNRRRDARTRRRYTEELSPVGAPPAGDDLRFEKREAIEATLKKLPYPYREILVLRYVEELSIARIAALLDLGQSAAKMRLSRAREQFQAEFAHQ